MQPDIYDFGFMGVLDTLELKYDVIDFDQIKDKTALLEQYGVVISVIVEDLDSVYKLFESIKSEVESALKNDVEFIIANDSVAALEMLNLMNVSQSDPWYPKLNDTEAVTSIVVDSAITKDINSFEHWDKLLGKSGLNMIAKTGDGIFWRVINDYTGTYIINDGFVQCPLYFIKGIMGGIRISEYDYFCSPMQFLKYNSRLLYIHRFWTADNISG